MSARLPRFAALAASAVFFVACGNGPATSSAPPASPRGGSAQPSTVPSTQPSAAPSAAAVATTLLKVTSEGGFINPAANLDALPIVEVLTDGRILTPGATAAIAPGPLLATVDVRDSGATGAAAIVAAIEQAGLDRPATGGPGVPGDSGTDVFSVTIDGQTTDTRLAGGGAGLGGPGLGGPGLGGPGGPGLGGSGDPDRAAAFDLLTRLLDPTQTWGGAAAQWTTYAPSGYRVFVIPGAPAADPATTQTPVPWPLATPLAEFGTAAVPDRGIAGLRQGVVLGSEAATLGPILAGATVETGFTSGGETWTLAVRPLLPDELDG